MKNTRIPTFGEFKSGMSWITAMSANLIFGKEKLKRMGPVKDICTINEEKDDILRRAEWLCSKVIVHPRRLIENMPHPLGRYYMGQWAIYSCSHLAAALANISRLYPEEKATCLERMARIVEIVLSKELKWYDTKAWYGEDALESLDGNNSHMTYISILSWIITNYRLSGGDGRYDDLLHRCCATLNRRMLRERDLCLRSFPRTPIFIPDMMFTIVALKNYSILFGGMYADSVTRWINKAKREFIHPETGLMRSFLRSPKKTYISGAYTALNCYCLTMVDREFAEEQYLRMKHVLRQEKTVMGLPIVGIRERTGEEKRSLYFDVDAGPVAYGFSPSGTCWAIGCATFFGDWKFRNEMLRTAEIAGHTVEDEHTSHYRLGELAVVGEAVTLAMRTHMQHPTAF